MALLILVCLLPRLAFATPEGTILCIAIDHLSSDCHDVEDNCGSDLPEAHFALSSEAADTCVDVTGVPAGNTDRSSLSVASPHILHVLVDAIRVSPPAGHFHTPRIDGDAWPPSFCARAFNSSIAIRS
jgi:hypothetical protein